jgi:hypothetical protein
MQGDHSLKPEPSGCGTAALTTALAGALSVALAAVAILFLQARVTTDVRNMATGIADHVSSVLNLRPEVRVDDVLIVESAGPALELATAEASYLVRHSWSQRYLLSTKRLEIEAPFTAKAGFDFEEVPMRVTINPQTRAVRADLPNPQLLSLEMGDPKILRDEDGLWNKLTAEDRENAFRELRLLARKQAIQSDLLARARTEGNRVVTEALGDLPQNPRP